MKIVSDSHVGKRRPNNEDSVKSIRLFENAYLLMVADGVGGKKRGEVASAQAIHFVERYFRERIEELMAVRKDPIRLQEYLNSAIFYANHRVAQQAQTEEFFMMATTLVAALIVGNQMYVANVGDSRCYIFQNHSGSLRLITKDHTFVQELVDGGVITENEARVHSEKNKITRAIGLDEELMIDTYPVTLEEKDIVILCSDGLNGMLEDLEIQAIIQKGEKLEKIVESLIHKALEKGGVDNITVLCASYEKGGE